MNEKAEKLLIQIGRALMDIEDETNRVPHELQTVAELRFIKSVLMKIRVSLIQDDGRRDPNYSSTISRMAIEMWPIGHPIGHQICQIEYAYERLKPIL